MGKGVEKSTGEDYGRGTLFSSEMNSSRGKMGVHRRGGGGGGHFPS